MKVFEFVMKIVSKYLPIWIVFMSIIAYLFPGAFISIRHLTGPGLGMIFLLMGMSLSTESILSVLRAPKYTIIGGVLKWTITVGITVCIAYLFFQGKPELATGVILAGTVPSGTSANLYSFIAGGEVALSITLASVDTVISPVLTPTLVKLFAGQLINVEFLPLFLNIIYIVFIPLFLGLFLQWKWPRKVEYVKPYTSFLSTMALFIVVLSVVSSAQASLQQQLDQLPLVFAAVFLQVAIPMFAGYGFARFLKVPEVNCRSILFHVGICNTALSSTLAMEHISSVAAVPAVANMVVNLTLGALVANRFAFSHRGKGQGSAAASKVG
ncbi:bile acid:sodium symporter family protein [Neobacillus mesonae]|uniref:bile acid:sodium symporter family protein n=1 Tax=Neobacillus mesonae TaxID=1193713 RepID=UPI00203EE5EB|nr:bile acid:sodium symporter family protein [Neobacillus mesonae]MCM3568501.1 bile acid:sodium symporter family protein [Neobacillus mesonae]